MKPVLLILAAGMGSRYGGLKQMDPIGPSGEAIMDYSIYDAIKAGFGKIVFVIRRDIEKDFRELFIDKLQGRIEIDYVFQDIDMLPGNMQVPEGRKKPWGTAHAMLVAAEKIDAPFAVINADDYYGPSSYKVMADYLMNNKEDNSYSMVGFQLDKTLSEHGHVSRGVCEINKDGHLVEVVERTKISNEEDGIYYYDNEERVGLKGDETVSMNFWGFKKNVFKYLESYFLDFVREHGKELKSEFFIPLIATRLINEKIADFKILKSGESWFGVTYSDDKPQVVSEIRKRIEQGIYPEKLWS